MVNDDGSTDGTLSILGSYSDARIKILPFDKHLGPLRGFERAITYSRGDFIFLCDQDDIWQPQKVQTMIRVFDDPRVLAVVSDAIVVDASDRVLLNSFQNWRGSAEGFWRNWMKNGFLGCCMAFRGSVKDKLLPFPQHINMHDEWIGLYCSVAGRVRFIDNLLTRYRRHGNNVTGMSHRGVAFMALKRVQFLAAITTRLPSLIYFRIFGR